MPDLAEGCEAVLTAVADRLIADPDSTIRTLASIYGRAGEVVLGAAESAAADPRLPSQPAIVIQQACPDGF